MKALMGSERQVEWAEDIRARYTKTAKTLKEIIDIYSDTTQKEIVDHDPIFGDEIRKVYTRNTNNTTHQAAISDAHHWELEKKLGKSAAWKLRRSAELKATGEAHSDRKAQVEYISATLAALEKALEQETDSRYWIDRR